MTFVFGSDKGFAGLEAKLYIENKIIINFTNIPKTRICVNKLHFKPV